MATVATLRRFALALPEATEVIFKGEPWFVVRKKTFALWSERSKRAILKLDREHQNMLFDVRPDVFAPCKVGTGGVWSYVDIAKLPHAELKGLVTEAWTQVVPKKIGRAFASAASRTPRSW